MKFIPELEEDGEINSVVTIGSDISEITRAAKALKETKILLRQIMDAPNIGIGVFRALKNDKGTIIDYQVEFVNNRTLQTFGGKDPAGTLLSSHNNHNTEQLKYFEEVIHTGKRNYYSRQTKSGIVDRWFLFSNVPLGNDRLVQIWEDISEIKTRTTNIW